MKNLGALIGAVVVILFSLQSCVPNYIVANQTFHQPQSAASLAANINANIMPIDETVLESLKENSNQPSDVVPVLVKKKNEERLYLIESIMEEAYSYLGTPYRFGGTTRSGIDCSAFVRSVFNMTTELELPRVAAAQAQEGDYIDRSDLRKGDLVFFAQRNGRGRISHVGIVEEVTPEGEVKFIHAATSQGVMISSLDSTYWGGRFAYAKRILEENYY